MATHHRVMVETLSTLHRGIPLYSIPAREPGAALLVNQGSDSIPGFSSLLDETKPWSSLLVGC